MFRIFILTAIVLAMTLPAAAQFNRDCGLPEGLHDYPASEPPRVDVIFRMLIGDLVFWGKFQPHFSHSRSGVTTTWEFASVDFYERSADGSYSDWQNLFEPQRAVENGWYLSELYSDYFRLEFCNYLRYVGFDDSEPDDGQHQH